MSTSRNNYDAIEQVIFDAGLRIQNIEIKSDINRMLVFLNTNHILVLPLSSYKRLANAKPQFLKQFNLIANGTGVHWPKLDEDLSLKGFLKDALQQMVTEKQAAVV